MNIFDVLYVAFMVFVPVWVFYYLAHRIARRTNFKWWYKNMYLRTPSWKLARRVVFFLRGKKCEICGKTWRLQVHHKTYKHLGNEWLHPNDLQILCRDCHKKAHGIKE